MKTLKTLKICSNTSTTIYKNVIEFVFGHKFLFISYCETNTEELRSLVLDLNTVDSVMMKSSNQEFKHVKIPKRI